MTETLYKVSEVARLANVTVRTLHHYDDLGLLRPSGRSRAGYRLYSDADLLRLHRIVVGRSLGLALEEIRRTLDDPTVDPAAVLRSQRQALVERLSQTHAKIAAIDAALRRMNPSTPKDDTMTPQDMFDGFDPADYEAEAQQRWGDSPAWAEASRRTKAYSPEDWARLKGESHDILTAFAAARDGGLDAHDVEVMQLAERHRLHIDRWFYPCSHQMHGNLAAMYLADARFAASFDAYGEALTPYIVAAIRANIERAPEA